MSAQDEEAIMEAPVVQEMRSDVDFEHLRGAVVRRSLTSREGMNNALGWEKAWKYRISALPEGKHVARTPDDKERWRPTDTELAELPDMLMAVERSNAASRVCLGCLDCVELRKLTFDFQSGGQKVFSAHHGSRCGGFYGSPAFMPVSDQEGKRIGLVEEDYHPYCNKLGQECCFGTFYTSVFAGEGRENGAKYTVRYNEGCCGRVNNCFGGTCMRPDAILDILSKDGQLVATIQQTYARDKDARMEACCRSYMSYNNYVVEFPQEATDEDKKLLLAAVLRIDVDLLGLD